MAVILSCVDAAQTGYSDSLSANID